MLIGRGEHFAWTLTSAEADIIDSYAETLCGGSKLKYEYKGKCLPMQKINAGTITKGDDEGPRRLLPDRPRQRLGLREDDEGQDGGDQPAALELRQGRRSTSSSSRT